VWRAAVSVAADAVFVAMMKGTSTVAAIATCHKDGGCIAGVRSSSTS
jgi:hypothetical protein